MPDSFLLSHVGFDESCQPVLGLEAKGDILNIPILSLELSYLFDRSVRYCTGWINIETKAALPCPENAIVSLKYSNCPRCNQRTGFNPAFYNAKTISDQQARLNRQPHFVYLAYFAPELVKVGISQESRGISRLLEQGARAALKLETFPSAYVARQYEQRISRELKLAETVSISKKIHYMTKEFQIAAANNILNETLNKIEKQLSTDFSNAKLIETNKYFFSNDIDLSRAVHHKELLHVVGRVVAMIGSLIVSEHRSNLLIYDMKSFIGYKARFESQELDITTSNEQLTLF